MAVELKRGCGFREVGGFYLAGGFQGSPCDRLPIPLHECPCCGGLINPVRSALKRFNAHIYFGDHGKKKNDPCADMPGCRVCFPADAPAFAMNVGESFYPTPEAFYKEAQEMGISRRLSSDRLPDGFVVGETSVYFIHPKACTVVIPHNQLSLNDSPQPRLIDAPEVKKEPGVFMVWTPKRLETLMWENDATPKKVAALEAKGITVIKVKDGDPDHMPRHARENRKQIAVDNRRIHKAAQNASKNDAGEKLSP